ncbi:matrix metalloproteinase-17 isoform X2 [Scyliorhinus torazame]|uniref:matrix metalloproteinase-17 isoform X2 n=1 Tax=Scyliorhinus torazame TaxID=75743 RepID=UPI003B59ED08
MMLTMVTVLILSLSGAHSGPAPSDDMDTGIEWLTKFGYLPPPDPVTGQLQTQEALTKAIKAMQKFGGLEINGVMDQATLTLMKTPRCSLPDIVKPEISRRRRSAQTGTKWNKRNISWRVRTFPKASRLSRDTIRALMYYALKVWSDIAPLNFHEVAGNNADILIDFPRSNHEDHYPFDGPGGTVAHAFFPGDNPIAGDVHFDDDEAWTFRSAGVRELMLFPSSQPQMGNSSDHPVLPAPPARRPTARPRTDVADRCNTNFDAVAQIRGEAFFFKGKYFWRLMRNRHLVSLQPAEIQRFWRGLPSNMDGVDSVYERTADHKIVFFKGERYWVFKDNNVEESYPRFISDFGLSVKSIDAAFVCPHDDKTYFFRENQYWRYDDQLRKMDPNYPKDTVLWKGLPSHVDDAMKWSDGAAYFFKGKNYWKVTDNNMAVAPGYPRSVARDWLACSEMQADSSISDQAHSRPRTGRGHQDESRSWSEKRNCTCTSAAETSRLPAALRRTANLLLLSVACLWLGPD